MKQDTLDDNSSQNMEWLSFASDVLRMEAEAILAAADHIDSQFMKAVTLLDRCTGKVVTTGVGKSGIVSKKLAATLTSTGCPAVFLHPSEAMHGDLGIVKKEDVVIALSNGGESEELLSILPALLTRGVAIIAIVGRSTSTLAQKANVVLDASIEREACPLNLAPTTSVIVAMALGDALAMTLQKLRGFGPEDYALNHPGGRLGRRLTLRVRDVMAASPDGPPQVTPQTSLMDTLCEMSNKGLGITGVTSGDGRLIGIITDGDLRRAAQKYGAAAFSQTAEALMTGNPAVVLHPDQLAFDALQLLENRPRQLMCAPVVDDMGRYVGVVRIHDIIRAGL